MLNITGIDIQNLVIWCDSVARSVFDMNKGIACMCYVQNFKTSYISNLTL